MRPRPHFLKPEILGLVSLILSLSCTGPKTPSVSPSASLPIHQDKPDSDHPNSDLTKKITPIVRIDAPRLETRAVWIPTTDLLEGKTKILQNLDRLKAAGFNTLYVDFQMRGYVIYPRSKILPQLPAAASGDTDIFSWMIPQAKKRGFRIEAWSEYGFYAHWHPQEETPTPGKILTAHPELTSVMRDGSKSLTNSNGTFYGLCPANPASHQILINLYVEAMTRYEFDGLHLDRVRFMSGDHCFCDFCKLKYQKDTGSKLLDFAKDSPEENQWHAWRKDQTAVFMKAIRSEFRKRFPKLKLTGAVVPVPLIEERGQDWPRWLREGWIDAVSPMTYVADLENELIKIDALKLPWDKIFPGVTTSPDTIAPQALPLQPINQIYQTRKHQAGGMTFWFASSTLPIVDALAKGPFNEPRLPTLE